jgi:hypothetical protein
VRLVDPSDAVPVAADVDAASSCDIPEGALQPGNGRARARQQSALQGLGDAALLGVELVEPAVEALDGVGVLLRPSRAAG